MGELVRGDDTWLYSQKAMLHGCIVTGDDIYPCMIPMMIHECIVKGSDTAWVYSQGQ